MSKGVKWDKTLIYFYYIIIMKHKTEDYKLSAVKYYLSNSFSLENSSDSISSESTNFKFNIIY